MKPVMQQFQMVLLWVNEYRTLPHYVLKYDGEIGISDSIGLMETASICAPYIDN